MADCLYDCNINKIVSLYIVLLYHILNITSTIHLCISLSFFITRLWFALRPNRCIFGSISLCMPGFFISRSVYITVIVLLLIVRSERLYNNNNNIAYIDPTENLNKYKQACTVSDFIEHTHYPISLLFYQNVFNKIF